MSSTIILAVQSALGILLIAAILLQRRGAGLSGTFGGADGSSYATRRGAERILFIATIVLAVLFVGTSIVRLLV